ncbi:phage tail tip lysozyme [Streptococcus pneumoniae]|uniref:CHAP domain containing protein n=1 Tax=Streptococcus pneumoniae TaxID=1313 RepID=A0AA95IIB1_STREE|nr:phage tail tip lysozyme [Streptococcus pneumoniae]MDS2295223.1 phage tail tip lysozyme [Streptococcus pneumoniae]MDS2574507.1 phage tail tip lysozyme [Streptococcus pneumoniae]MDS2653608.1 phage tail tip lysozyme [Streptococcus pneumoniae]MDS2764372.1 phage tail tip lysozyme [Streptococcus pneumoniae]MDS3357887.1 phage tail tip lysozyme [Streptococcus pneumoniae]
MTLDKQNVKVARKTFQSSLKASRIHYRREKKGLKRSLPKRRFIIRRAEKAETREQRQTLKQTYQEEKDLATDTFTKAISYVSPRWLKVKDIRKYRLPQARHRLTVARKHLAEIKMAEKEQAINPKFTYQKEPNKKTPSRFHFQKEKSLDRLQAEKKVNSAKRDVKQLKRAHKAKKASTKVKRGLRYVASDSLDLVAQDDDLEGIRTVKDMSIKGRRYGRFIYQSGKLLVTSGQTGMRFTKTKIAHGKERYQNFKKGKGFTRQKPLKHKRRYHTFLKQARKHSVSGIKGVIQAIKGSLTFFSTIVLNPMTWVVSGLLFFLLLMMSFVVGISGTSLIQQNEGELTKAYTHMTWEDAENTRTNDTGITYYTKIDDVMGFMNLKYQDYALEEVMENGDKTYQAYLSQLWHDLNGGDSLKAMLELTKEPAYKLSDDDREELKELSKEGTYLALQELDNPFQGQTEDDTLTMTVRYGYEMIEDKPTLHHHIILEAKENQVIVAPMDGKVSLDGENLIITSGKGLNKSQLTLFNVHTGRVTDGQKVQAGEMIGQTKDGSGLKVTYQKVDDDSEKLVYVNPAFYFPKVIQLQTTILPTIGQFGGDEFARAKAIYEYLKSQGATNQAIAAILGNWSVESSINPKRAEGDYLSPPVGATDSSWDDEGWLSLNGPAIYNGRYPNILRRGLGLGQWTDTADGSRRHTLLLKYAKRQNQKWYDLDLQLDFMLHGDNPYYTNWLKDFFKNSGSPASLAQLFLIYWEGNSGDKLLERQTRATEWYYQIEKGFSQPNGGTAQSDPKALEAVREDLYDNSIPGGGDGMGYAYGQCTWGVAVRINQLGLKLKGRTGEKISIINTMGNGQDWVGTAVRLGGETGKLPKAGAIISFAGGQYGHVGFVEKVYPDGSFLISETNYNGNPNYTFRKLSGVDGTISFAYTMK